MQVLKSIRHVNIVAYVELIISEHHLNLVLEYNDLFLICRYIENGALSQVVKQFGSLPEKLAALYMKQVLTGLAHLHAHDITHRDIKGFLLKII